MRESSTTRLIFFAIIHRLFLYVSAVDTRCNIKISTRPVSWIFFYEYIVSCEVSVFLIVIHYACGA